MPGGLVVNGKRMPTNDRSLISLSKKGKVNEGPTLAKINAARRKKGKPPIKDMLGNT